MAMKINLGNLTDEKAENSSLEVQMQSMFITGTTGSGVNNLFAKVVNSVGRGNAGNLDVACIVKMQTRYANCIKIDNCITVKEADKIDEAVQSMSQEVRRRVNGKASCDLIIIRCIEELTRYMDASENKERLTDDILYILRQGAAVGVYIIACTSQYAETMQEVVETFPIRLCCRSDRKMSLAVLNSDAASTIVEKCGYAYKFEAVDIKPEKFKYA